VAAARCGGLSDALKRRLLDAYQTLNAYADVAPALQRLRARGAKTAIFSNGTRPQLDIAVEAAGLNGLLDAIISVDDIGVYKTDPRAYALVTQHFACTPQEIIFQSSNRWDIAGGRAFGFACNWINRSGQPDEYADLQPHHIYSDLNGL